MTAFRSMLKRWTAIPLLVVLVLVVSGANGDAQEAMLSVSASQSLGLWQSEPPAFSENTRGLGLSLGITYRQFAISAGMSLLDLKTFQTSVLSSFDVSARWIMRKTESVQITAIGGMALLPDLDWTGPYAGVVGSHSPWPFLEIWMGPIVQTTDGADCCHGGTSVRVSAGIDLLFELSQ